MWLCNLVRMTPDFTFKVGYRIWHPSMIQYSISTLHLGKLLLSNTTEYSIKTSDFLIVQTVFFNYGYLQCYSVNLCDITVSTYPYMFIAEPTHHVFLCSVLRSSSTCLSRCILSPTTPRWAWTSARCPAALRGLHLQCGPNIKTPLRQLLTK